MNKLILMALGAATFFTACQDAPKADSAEATEAQTVQTATQGTTYKVDPAQTTIEWVGTKPTGRHHGTFKVKDGSLMVDNMNITGGSFVIDIKSIKPDDQDEKGNAKLQGHLLSADFFDADKHPEGKFEITSVSAGADSTNKNVVLKDATHTITGNLTLKGVTKSITFPAKVNITDAQATADANFNIDRTQWGMNYQSDKSIQDKFIDTDVNLQIHLVATK